MGTILFIIAVLLAWILTPLFFIYAFIRLHNFKRIANYLGDVAFALDQLGNVMGAPIMNDLLLKDNIKYPYGNPDHTISHVTGVNYLNNNLTWKGIIVAKILNKVDKNHVEKAAVNEQ